MSSHPLSPTPERTRDAVVLELQPLLVDLLDLAMQAKQAHWTVTGATFFAVHSHLDKLNKMLRKAGDEIAERCATLDRAPDGTVQRVAESTLLPPLERGFGPAQQLLDQLAARLAAATARTRERIDRLDSIDRLSADMVARIATDMEKQCWMLQAYGADVPERVVGRQEGRTTRAHPS